MLTADQMRVVAVAHAVDERRIPHTDDACPEWLGAHAARAALLAFVRGVADIDPGIDSCGNETCMYCRAYRVRCRGDKRPIEHATDCLWLVAQGAKEPPAQPASLPPSEPVMTE